jgi:uncharacterized protein (TIGR01777 family)
MRFVRSLPLPVTAAEAFAWHERPGAFERLTPPWERVDVESHVGGIRDGARVVLRARVGPFTTRWRLEHRDYVAGCQFHDVQLAGPFASWRHRHLFRDDGPARSVLTDDIELTTPLGGLGALVAGRTIHRRLDRLFAYRHAVTAADLARHQPYADRAPLTVAVTGATGLIGAALTAFLTTGGHTVRRVTRQPRTPGDIAWDPASRQLDPRALEGIDAVAHLAGASVDQRWTAAHKREIMRSRADGTRLIAETIARLDRPPRTLVSGSAVGYYGSRGDEVLDERSAPGHGFLADVCRAWEAATEPAEQAGIRVVHPRLGVVLSPRGGMLAKLLIPFRLGLGGKLGDGHAWMSCVALDDVVGALHFALMTDTLRGPANVSLPEPVTNAAFSRTLAETLHRPSAATVPEFALKLVMGAQQAEEMALTSQRVLPRALLDAGFHFRHPTIGDALRFELGRS